ncbi:MAG: restriction endonuclease subunit S [Verrucomicrobiota bacterium]
MKKLPLGWSWSRFREIVEDSQYGLSTQASPQGITPILRMNNIDDGKLILANLVHVNLSGDELKSYRLKKGDLLFNRTNSAALVGKTALFTESRDYVCASYLVRFRLRLDRVDPQFVCYVFTTSQSQRIFHQLATKAVAQVNINPTALQQKFCLPIPPLQEQKEIANTLMFWDDSIQKQEKLLSVKKEGKQGLMQQLLTGKSRFKKFKGERWHTYRLGELFTERVEIARGDLPLVAITGQNGVVPRDSLTKRDSSSEDKSKYLRITPGDIGYNTMRMWQGVAGLSQIEGIVSPAYTVCIPSNKIDGQFAAYLFKHLPMIHAFRRNSQGLVDDTLSLKFPNFARIHVTIPDVPEQKRIAAVLSTCDREIELLQKQLAALKAQKRGLMQKLLTGEIRVKTKINAQGQPGKRSTITKLC